MSTKVSFPTHPLRIAIIGAGGIAAKMHLPELEAHREHAHVALIAGRNPQRLELLAAQYGTRWTQNFDEAVNDTEIDAVIVATPHPHHVAWGMAALEAGKHLLVEKPLCSEMSGADAFVAAAERAATRGQVTLCLPHFSAAVHEMKRLVEAGELGRITGANARTAHAGPEVYYREVAAIFGENIDEDNLWFFDATQAGVGALFDMGVYAVAHIVALLGSVRRVSAFMATLDKPTTLEDGAALLLEMENGALAVAETSWCDGARTWQVRLNGTRGKIEMNAQDVPRQFFPLDFQSDHAEIGSRLIEPKNGIGDVHGHWLDCIERGVQPPLSHPRAARHVTEILLAALQSGRSGEIVEVHSRAD